MSTKEESALDAAPPKDGAKHRGIIGFVALVGGLAMVCGSSSLRSRRQPGPLLLALGLVLGGARPWSDMNSAPAPPGNAAARHPLARLLTIKGKTSLNCPSRRRSSPASPSRCCSSDSCRSLVPEAGSTAQANSTRARWRIHVTRRRCRQHVAADANRVSESEDLTRSNEREDTRCTRFECCCWPRCS